MRTVTTFITSIKCTFNKFSTRVCSSFYSKMKSNESTETVQQNQQSRPPRQPSPTPTVNTEKPPVSWMTRSAQGAQAAHAAVSSVGASNAAAASAAAAQAAATQAAAAVATQALAMQQDDFPALKKKIQEFIPKLKPHLHKGDCGRVAVFGGCFEYTGAPFFAAMSALKLGADLVHVFCTKDAGPVIKSYSPELIVHACLDSSDGVKHIEPWLEKFHVLLIGPGLGRSAAVLKHVSHVINFCKKILRPCPPLVLDADALYLVTEDMGLIKRYPAPVFMTPNTVEFSKLATRASESNPSKLAYFYNAVILQKGIVDVISNGFHTNKSAFPDIGLTSSMPGAKRRCGGQGDVLAGCLATLVVWAHNHVKNELKLDFSKIENEEPGQYKAGYLRDTFMVYSLAAYAASVMARASSKLAYDVKGRGLTATDIVAAVEKAFKAQFEV